MRKEFRFVTEEKVTIVREHFIVANSLEQAHDILDEKDVKSGEVIYQEQDSVYVMADQTREIW